MVQLHLDILWYIFQKSHNEISDRRRKDSQKKEEKQRMTGRDMDHRENQQ